MTHWQRHRRKKTFSEETILSKGRAFCNERRTHLKTQEKRSCKETREETLSDCHNGRHLRFDNGVDLSIVLDYGRVPGVPTDPQNNLRGLEGSRKHARGYYEAGNSRWNARRKTCGHPHATGLQRDCANPLICSLHIRSRKSKLRNVEIYPANRDLFQDERYAQRREETRNVNALRTAEDPKTLSPLQPDNVATLQ